MKKLLLIMVFFAIAAIIWGGQREKKIFEAITFENIAPSAIKDGHYQGRFDSKFIHVMVEVKVANGIIRNIDLIKHDNGKGEPAEALLEQMVTNNTTDVDAISGATASSKAIRKAVENALRKGLVQ